MRVRGWWCPGNPGTDLSQVRHDQADGNCQTDPEKRWRACGHRRSRYGTQPVVWVANHPNREDINGEEF